VPLMPSSALYPDTTLYPGTRLVAMALSWGMAGVSAGTSTARAGVTSLGGTSAGQSQMGSPLRPASNLYPSTSLYPGFRTTELNVAAGSNAVLVTLSATVDVLITLDAVADVSGTLQSNALLVTLGAS
jgi:hypothetical protein